MMMNSIIIHKKKTTIKIHKKKPKSKKSKNNPIVKTQKNTNKQLRLNRMRFIN